MDNQIDNNLMETVSHGSISFPFVVYRKSFNNNGLKYISTHWHNEIELIYCDEGEMSYTTSNEQYTLNCENFIVVNQNNLHQADMTGESKWYAVLFDPKMLYGFEESKIKEILSNIKFSHILITDKYLVGKLKSLISLYSKKNTPMYELMVHQALEQLYIEILNLVMINIPQDTVSKNTNQIKVHQMLEYIYSNYKTKITIEDVAEHAGLCRSDACKFFKESLKSSIADYILRLRLEKSIALLLSGNMSISDIAAQCGFNSASYYAEAFKKVIGMTPLEYKKKNA